MRALCVTVDLDRDVNVMVPGSTAAGSIDRGKGTGPRFSSSEKGLSILSDLFDELSIKATFFAEAATLRRIDASALSGHCVGMHGVDHEDISLIKSVEEKRAILEEAAAAVKDAVGHAPECFRAPYMSADEATIDIISQMGIKADSSRYAPMSGRLMPHKIRANLWEMAVPEGIDINGKKIAAYLWPMHESKRRPEDYLRMASQMKEGAFVLATHTWHMVESRERGVMAADEIEKNIDNVRTVLEGMTEMGMEPLTLTGVRKIIEKDSR